MSNFTTQKYVLKIYIDNTDKYNNQPLWKYILESIKEANLAGATVYKAVAGIGEHSLLHTFDILNLSNEMPLIIEIIENEEKLTNFLESHKKALSNLFITKHPIEIISYSKNIGE